MLTAAEIQSLLAEMLAGVVGGPQEEWRSRIGELEVLSLAAHPRCNWSVVPTGTPQQVAAIDTAVELVRGEHPHARR